MYCDANVMLYFGNNLTSKQIKAYMLRNLQVYKKHQLTHIAKKIPGKCVTDI